MPARTATILTRTDPETKDVADAIFAQLGLSTSGAINIFLHQAIIERGLPFQAKLSRPNLPDMNLLSDAEVENLLVESRQDVASGNIIPAQAAFAKLRSKNPCPAHPSAY